MNINIKLGKNFTTQYNKMVEKYGEEFELLNGFHDTQMNYTDFIDNFTKDNVSEVTIDANANAFRKDICSLNAEKSKSHDKLLTFNKIFYELQKKYGIKVARDWLEQEWSGGFYLHDSASASQKPYCYSYDLTRLATEGLFFLAENYNNEPPKHLDTFNDDFIEFVSWSANRTSGSVGCADYLIWSWYFWNKDKEAGKFWEKHGDKFVDESDKARRQAAQKVIYRLNQPFLRVDQSAFTNFSIFDRNYLEELFGGKEFPDGTFAIDHIEEIIEHEKVFMEVYSETKKRNFMTFPVITISLLYRDGKFVDEEFARWANRHNIQFNDSNFFVSGDIGVLSSCCRMQNDTRKLSAFINSIGGTSLSIGSVKVNTINLMRIALESERDEDKYIKILKDRTILCMKVLDVVRHIIQRNVEKGLLNNYIDGCIDMEKQFVTIGINAMYEAIEYFGYIETDEFGNKSYSDKGLIFASKIMDTINELKDEFTDEYSRNVEAVPAEQCAKILCRKDELLFNRPRVRPLYSNQWIPLMEKCTIKEKLRLGAILDNKCGGGLRKFGLQSKFCECLYNSVFNIKLNANGERFIPISC